MRMYMYLSVFACLCAWNVASAHAQAQSSPAVPAPAANDATSSALRQDARLDSLISLREIGVPLAGLLDRLSTPDMRLKTDANSAEQKLQIRLHHRPLRTLLQAIVELIHGDWVARSDGKGYVFHTSAKTVAERSRWWQLYLSDRDRALAAQHENVLKQMRTVPVKRPANAPNPEHLDLEEQRRMDVIDATHQRFFNTLPASMQEQIANHVTDFPLYAGFYTHGANEGAFAVPISELPQSNRDLLQREYAGFWEQAHVRPEQVTITFANTGGSVIPVLTLPNGYSGDTAIRIPTATSSQPPMLRLIHPNVASYIQRLGSKAPSTWKALAVYQQRRVWPNDAPPADLPHRMRPRRADVLNWLGEQADLEYVADYYSLPGDSMAAASRKRPLTRPLKTELDIFAAQQDSSWKQTPDKVCLARNNRWYRDDLLEVPDALLKRLHEQIYAPMKSAQVSEQTPIPPPDPETLVQTVRRQLAWETDVLAALTPWQIAYGLQWAAVELQEDETLREKHKYITAKSSGAAFLLTDPADKTTALFPFSSLALHLLKQRHLTLFYAGLSAPQQNALLHDVLPTTALTAAQFEQAVYVLPHLRAMTNGQSALLGLYVEPELPISLSPGAIAGGYAIHLTTKAAPDANAELPK